MIGDFTAWLTAQPPAPAAASEAHRRLVAIHPFNDGNGRTARLVLKLMLIRAGYPPVAIGPPHRPAYMAALQADQAGEGSAAFDTLLVQRLDETLDEALHAAAQALPSDDKET